MSGYPGTRRSWALCEQARDDRASRQEIADALRAFTISNESKSLQGNGLRIMQANSTGPAAGAARGVGSVAGVRAR